MNHNLRLLKISPNQMCTSHNFCLFYPFHAEVFVFLFFVQKRLIKIPPAAITRKAATTASTIHAFLFAFPFPFRSEMKLQYC